MGRHQIDEIEVRLHGHGRHVIVMKMFNDTAYQVSLLPGMRSLMAENEVGICGDGRTEWKIEVDSDAPELAVMINFVKEHPGHYDYGGN